MDPNNKSITDSFRIGPDKNYALFTITPDGKKGYLCSFNSNAVLVFDTQTKEVLATIPVDKGPLQCVLSPDGSKLYVGCREDFETETGGSEYYAGYYSQLYVIDTATNTVITKVKVGPEPVSIAFSPDGSKAYVLCHESQLYTVDTLTHTVDPAYPNGVVIGHLCGAIVLNPAGTIAYVTNVALINPEVDEFATANVAVVDLTTMQILQRVAIGKNPSHLALVPSLHKLYVADCDEDTITVLNVSP